MSTLIKSFCRNCSSNCGLEFEVSNNTVISYRQDREHQLSKGYLCIKGRMSVDLLNGAEGRLVSARKRQADGAYVDIAKEEALDQIAGRLTSIIQDHGPQSVAVFQGTGGYMSPLGYALMKSFISVLGTHNYFSTMTIDQSAKWVALGRIGTMLSGRRFMSESDVVLIAGNNPAVSHFGYPFSPMVSTNPTKHIDAFRARGGKLIVVDPRRTETARLSDLHLQLYPGEDATLFAGLIRLILVNGWEDKDFCGRFVTNMVQLRSAVAAFTPEYVATRTGVPAELLQRAAEMYGKAARPAAGSGTGANMGSHSNLAEHMIETLNLICGGYRKAGETVANPGTLFRRPFIEEVLPPNRTWERGPKCRTQGAGRIFGEFPSSLLPQEITTPGENKIRALIVFAANPAIAIVDPAVTVPALKELDLLVTVDPRMNETAKLSHYVVATAVQYERHDLTLLGDSTSWTPFAQYTPPVVDKPPNTLDDWEFFWGIASRMGLTLTLKNPVFGIDYKDIPGGDELDRFEKPTSEQLIEALCSQGAIPLSDLKAHPGGFIPKSPPVIVQQAPHDNRARLDICPDDVADDLTKLRVEETTQSAEFHFRLATRRLLESMNSAFRDAQTTRRRYPTNFAYMHPDDMKSHGLKDGDAIDIVSEHDQIIGIVRKDSALKRSVISMAHLWGALDQKDDPDGKRGGLTGRLVSLREHREPINFMPRQTGIPVNVTKRSLHMDGTSPISTASAVSGSPALTS